ncbi:penicillin acylase family protein [Opitutales bacterium ASA1]|nr:penicillin acylase family protein [Opitutales bacterium ASA1]
MIAAVVTGLGICALAFAWLLARGSLPAIEGELAVSGLRAPVSIERDALGIPTIRGRDRVDLAWATGFVHAQDRFFQMDLRRRAAAGELSALFGRTLLSEDRRVRVHRFRARAEVALRTMPARDRELLGAYASGVNAGLESLRVRPFEYLALRSEPRPWAPEDSLLAAWSMFLELQGGNVRLELTRDAMHRALSPELYSFFTDNGSAWEATLDDSRRPVLPVPGPEHFAFLRDGWPNTALREPVTFDPWETAMHRPSAEWPIDVAPGSNNWAVGGAFNARGGGAIVANDMHLSLRDLPPVWYRFRLIQTDGEADGREAALDVSGLSFPGVHLVATGSNGRVAWGFTNSSIDLSDAVVVETVPGDQGSYLTPDGPRTFVVHEETIVVRGGASEVLRVEDTVWGPVLPGATDGDGRRIALAWVAHDASIVDLRAIDLEHAGDVREAIEVVRGAWFPTQNLVVGDAAGSIAWTLLGPVPKRVGFGGERPVSMADGASRWDGLRSDIPVVIDPPHGRLWTANARVLGGEEGAALGDGGLFSDGRAYRIRERLFERETFDELAHLAIQLDDRTVLLDRWANLAAETLDEAAVTEKPGRAEIREVLATWSGAATADSRAHLFVHGFRRAVAQSVYSRMLAPAKAVYPQIRYGAFAYDEPLLLLASGAHAWTTVHPGGWRGELLEIIDEIGVPARPWGDYNRVDMTHPLGRVVGALGPLLGVERTPVSGDSSAINARLRQHGPSGRMVVSPGAERAGILHLPGGQSGHPLSPFYRAGHEAWLRGQPTAFLPGEPKHRLSLAPADNRR